MRTLIFGNSDIRRKPSASRTLEGLSKKLTPEVILRICRRGHVDTEDRVVNSGEYVMSQSEMMRYKWDEIDWRKLERNVFKLQKRIYRASNSGDRKRLHQLQKLLLKSKGAKLLAVRRVAQLNTGKKTAGIDGVKSLSPTQRMKLANELNLNEKSMPVRRIWIPKPGKSEKRPLGIPTMADRAKQALANMTLEPEWEAKFEPNSYGFRPSRSCWDVKEAIYTQISKKNAFVLDADIKGCFDNIDQKELLKKINTFPKLRRAIKGWLKAGIMEGDVFHKPKAGTPQGGVISPLLANIALHGVEYDTQKALCEELDQYQKITRKASYKSRALKTLHITRYADDFVVIHKSRGIVEKAKVFIENWLKQIGLTLHETKTRITHTLNSIEGGEIGFKFLGFSVRQYYDMCRKRGYVTLIKPSPEGQKKHREIIKGRLKKLSAAAQEEVIENLNPIIRGWSNYYRTSVARKVFEKMDHYMFQCLWKWARWRHPTKGLKWVKDKYFRRYKNNCWRFMTKDRKLLSLHSDTRIKRHVKIQGTRTPYDGDVEYWAKRMGKRFSGNNSKLDLARCA